MEEIIEADYIYAAGFIDGEGHIGIMKMTGNSNINQMYPSYTLLVQIYNTNLEVLEWFQRKFGGKFYEVMSLQPNRKDQWYWKLTSKSACEFLKLIRPYCIVKREQVKLAIEFYDSKKNFTGYIIPKEEVEKREQFYLQFRKLNQKGVH